jgi:hypothetical protein
LIAIGGFLAILKMEYDENSVNFQDPDGGIYKTQSHQLDNKNGKNSKEI